MNVDELIHKLKIIEEENKRLQDELIQTKEHLKKYTAPASRKLYYENNKEEHKQRVKEYKEKPVEDRKYISVTQVQKYIIINDCRQKHNNIIKKVLDGLSDVDISFIKEYHQENNLNASSNLSKRHFQDLSSGFKTEE